jgi:hypothetical protein
MRQFSVGEVVTWIPDVLLRSETRGNYRVVGELPDRDGDHIYRIKSPLEEYERVVKESLLVKSEGYLPEEVPDKRPRQGPITLPNLLQVEKRESSRGADLPTEVRRPTRATHARPNGLAGP